MTRRQRLATVAIAVVAATLLAACGNRNSPNMLGPKGSQARTIAGIWWPTFAMACAVYAIVAGLIMWAILRGRRTEEGKQSRMNDGVFIVVGGVAVPLVILMVLAGFTVHGTNVVLRRDAAPLQIDVTGKRWWWEVTYPDQGFVTANEIRVPVGRQVEVHLRTDDVIHSFWVPRLAQKVDMIPDQTNILRVTAREPGVYRGECAEFCGIEHARMNFLVIAEDPTTFNRWVARRQTFPSPPDTDLELRGLVAFQRNACAGCHTIAGTQADAKVGPDLTDFGGRQTIGADTVPNTTGNLAGWIANSQTIKPGNLMPPISLSPDELRAITAYLESLK